MITIPSISTTATTTDTTTAMITFTGWFPSEELGDKLGDEPAVMKIKALICISLGTLLPNSRD